jgi:hypothetical protein
MSLENAILAWLEAADDLKIKIQYPFALTTADNRTIRYDLLIEHFGSELGTLILSTDNMKAFKTAEEFGYYCSAIDPESYSTYDRETFIDTLNDWGYFGEISNTPKWYSGQAWQ